MKYTDQQLLEQLRALSKKLGGKTPSVKDIKHYRSHGIACVPTFINHFGNYNNALKSAGFEPNFHRYTKEQIKSALLDCSKGLGKIPKYADYMLYRETSPNKRNLPSISVVCNSFGTWNKTAEATFGVSYTANQSCTKERTLAALRRFMRVIDGSPPGTHRYDEWRKTASDNEELPQVVTVYKHFGSWRRALDAALARYPDICRFSKEQIASALEACSLLFNGRTPIAKEYTAYRNAAENKYELPDQGDIRLVYGSYKEAFESVFRKDDI